MHTPIQERYVQMGRRRNYNSEKRYGIRAIKHSLKYLDGRVKKISTIIRCCSMIKEECKILINERKECNEKQNIW